MTLVLSGGLVMVDNRRSVIVLMWQEGVWIRSMESETGV